MEVPWAPPTQHFGSLVQYYSSNAGIARRRHFLVDFDKCASKRKSTLDNGKLYLRCPERLKKTRSGYTSTN